MAELVDASVSNTDGVKPVPVRSRLWAHKRERRLSGHLNHLAFALSFLTSKV